MSVSAPNYIFRSKRRDKMYCWTYRLKDLSFSHTISHRLRVECHSILASTFRLTFSPPLDPLPLIYAADVRTIPASRPRWDRLVCECIQWITARFQVQDTTSAYLSGNFVKNKPHSWNNLRLCYVIFWIEGFHGNLNNFPLHSTHFQR
jgi:hypothetical protein